MSTIIELFSDIMALYRVSSLPSAGTVLRKLLTWKLLTRKFPRDHGIHQSTCHASQEAARVQLAGLPELSVLESSVWVESRAETHSSFFSTCWQ